MLIMQIKSIKNQKNIRPGLSLGIGGKGEIIRANYLKKGIFLACNP